MIDTVVTTLPDEIRYGVRTTGRRPVRGFETSDLNLQRQGVAKLLWQLLSQMDVDPQSGTGLMDCKKAARFMIDFFRPLSPSRYSFFTEMDEAQNVTSNVASLTRIKDPRQGIYPANRNGRSTRTPLRSFMHCKYTKSGQPAARLILPGKLTPPSLGGATPYEDAGSKLPRQPNGRYRHIASCSVEELIALGWDGAKYNSKTADHTWVPFICGYDSDPDDRYEPIDMQNGRRAGTIGIGDLVGAYMEVPGQGIVQLKK